MKGYMYILECNDQSFYVGSTSDLVERFMQHQRGEGCNYTKERLPVTLKYYEVFDQVKDAFRREKQIQGWSRAKKIALMQKNIKELELLAECRNESHYKNYHLKTSLKNDLP
jgi:putative endonuclease